MRPHRNPKSTLQAAAWTLGVPLEGASKQASEALDLLNPWDGENKALAQGWATFSLFDKD